MSTTSDTRVILVTIPGLREQDVEPMSSIRELMACGEIANLVPGFPCIGGPIVANMTTGRRPREHGITGDRFYDRSTCRFQSVGLLNDRVETPQIWDLLSQRDESLTSAVWFAPYAQESEADYVCCPSGEAIYTRPAAMRQTLTEQLGRFPGEQDEKSTAWIVDSAIQVAKSELPRFFYIRLPYLATVAERFGPDSPEVKEALVELDKQIGRLVDGLGAVLDPETTTWFVSGEYVVTPVDHVLYPNRILRGAGFLEVREENGKELIDFERSKAWAMTDGQISHIFLKDKEEPRLHQIVGLFAGAPGIDEVVVGAELRKYDLDHPRSGDVLLMSMPNSWQAYDWWIEDQYAPDFAHTVAPDLKPGYDPLELFAENGKVSLDVTLVRGSRGALAKNPSQHSVIMSSEPALFPSHILPDLSLFEVIMQRFGA
jgi:hypothetical protein